MVTVRETDAQRVDADDLMALDRIAQRVLWLSTAMIDHANHVRPNPEGIKIGGHQASSASAVGIMTALYFDYLRAGDRVLVKPHASPVFHAIQYLLGTLDKRYLTMLREFHGLQAYPSRTKDPDGVDFSGGSMGLGPVAATFAALVDRYVSSHMEADVTRRPRFVAVVGDAELDEGSVWEGIAEPALRDLENVLWIVDLNRQSLDRVVPGIRTPKLEAMFRAHDWQVIEVKYGHLLQQAFAQPGGEHLRHAIDQMPNSAYQRMLRAPQTEVRARLCAGHPDALELEAALRRWSDAELWVLVRNLGGHDLLTLREAFAAADASPAPTVIFAYTIKGWGLPIEGDPMNHSALLTAAQMESLRVACGIGDEDRFPAFAPDSPEGHLCTAAAARLRTAPHPTATAATLAAGIPTGLEQRYPGKQATQAVLGQVLVGLARDYPAIGARLVTASPDVATSTNLGGWINRVGVWTTSEVQDYFLDAGPRALQWTESTRGQHIELGISENNLCLLLGQLGLAQELHGELLLPIGTLYDPFVARGLDALIYGLYSGGRFIIVGTPSGITLSPEGGAHQSSITPSIGLAMPALIAYEPAFAKELEWILLDGLRSLCDRERGESFYLRLTTRVIDQDLMPLPTDPAALELLRREVLAGAYRVVDHRGEPEYRPGANVVQILASGAVLPEAVAASQALREEGVLANVINVTSADRLYRGYQESLHAALRGPAFPTAGHLGTVLPGDERRAPIVVVLDGHAHALAWAGGALGTRVLPLGVSRFGESGYREDLYQACAIDTPSIVEAALLALDD
jgi:pyruvate dehydrogenase E1 component